MTEHSILDIVTRVIVLCSVLHTILPPWDFLNEFPTAQKYYKLFIYVVGYVGVNARSTVYPKTLSMPNQVASGTPESQPKA